VLEEFATGLEDILERYDIGRLLEESGLYDKLLLTSKFPALYIYMTARDYRVHYVTSTYTLVT